VSASPAASPSATAQPDPGRRPVVACQRLDKVFKDFWLRDQTKALDALDLLVYEREVFGLLGPNGSGKSTAIKIILGLLKPTRGRVMVFEKPPTHVATKRRIGYLPEESYLYPFLNARETLDYYAKLFGIDGPARRRRIDELLEMVGLTHAQFRPVRDYSKGMQRRIGIAQALINDPDLLILDEPTTGLDPIGTRQVKDLIIELGRRGKTIILSSHLLSDVEDVVDRMVILYGGKIHGEGTCDELLSASERTTIETDRLDDETIARIDEIIRERSRGEKAIRSVHSPRQKLEELFLGIVERAQHSRAQTSGATRGGETASFLRGKGEPNADELIASLIEDDAADHDVPDRDIPDRVTAGPAGQPATGTPPQTPEAPSLIDELTGGDETHEPEPASAAEVSEPEDKPGRDQPPGARDQDIDEGVIGSLLDDDDHEHDDQDDNDDNEGQRRKGTDG